MRDSRQRFLCGLAVVGVLAGCAQIPSSGVPEAVGVEQQLGPAQGPAEVRVVAGGPRPGDSVNAIVAGFLEASGTVEENFGTARSYLTSPASGQWDPKAQISIYDHTGVTLAERANDRVVLMAPADGNVDAQGVFSPPAPPDQLMAAFGLTQVAGEWRIDTVPPGLFISRQDFEREYTQLRAYFPTDSPRASVLIPDPVYAPRSGNLLDARLDALRRGPSRWLNSVVTNYVPAELAAPVSVDSGLAQVRLTEQGPPADGGKRDLMLAQLVMTLTEDPEVQAVEVRAGDRLLTLGDAGVPQLRRTDVTPYLSADMRQQTPPAYFLKAGAAFVLGDVIAQGPFPAEIELAEFAASPDNSLLAGISADRTMLWTAPGGEPRRPEVRAEGKNLRSASFDGEGNLWLVAGEGRRTELRRYPPAGEPEVVAITGFEPRQITALSVAADGVRVAVVLDTEQGRQVYLALVEDNSVGVGLASLRRVAPELTNPSDVDWANPGQVAVLAAEPNAPPQPFGVDLGGQVVTLAVPLPDITAIAAAPDQPIIAATSDTMIWRLREGGNWFREDDGTAPAYPG